MKPIMNWTEIDAQDDTPASGRLRLRLEAPATLWITPQGGEAYPQGEAQAFDLFLPENVTFTFSEAVRAFMYVRPSRARSPRGEVFTNLDRKPGESGSVQEVRRAAREFALLQLGVRQRTQDDLRKANLKRLAQEEARAKADQERKALENAAPETKESTDDQP